MDILLKIKTVTSLKKIFINSARILVMKNVKVLDFSISSIGSIYSALKRTCAHKIEVVQDLKNLEVDELLVIPGKGNFGKASKALDKNNLRLDITDFIDNGGNHCVIEENNREQDVMIGIPIKRKCQRRRIEKKDCSSSNYHPFIF